MPVTRYIRVMKEEDLQIGKAAIVAAGEEEIALFNYKGKYYAIANKCPHKGSPLGEGRIEEGILICPGHEWRFNLKTGDCMQNPYMKTKIYPVKLRNGSIYIGFRNDGKKVHGDEASLLPSSLKFNISTIQKPINPDEQL